VLAGFSALLFFLALWIASRRETRPLG
jgi:hypothetical protein